MSNSFPAILLFGVFTTLPQNAQPGGKVHAQNLVDQTAKRHSEIAALEIAVTGDNPKGCATIASTEPKGIGEKCDADEEEALKTLGPVVEQEADGFDVTAPLHDANRNLVGTLGIDFKPKARQTRSQIVQLTGKLLKEMEAQIPSKDFLLQPVQ